MGDLKLHFKGSLPCLFVTYALFAYIEDKGENIQCSLWTSCFTILKAILAEICAFIMWKEIYHRKLFENEIFDLWFIHIFCIPMTMVIFDGYLLHWLLKLSIVSAIFLTFMLIRLLLGSFKQSKQTEVPPSRTHPRNENIENSFTRHLPSNSLYSYAASAVQRTIFNKGLHKEPIPRDNVQATSGACGDSLLNSFPTKASRLSRNPPLNQTEYHPAVLNSTTAEPTSEYQEPRKVQLSKSIQAGAPTTSMVESSTSTSPSYWNPLTSQQETKYNSNLTSSPLRRNSQMSVSQVSVSTQASCLTPTSPAWKVLEYKTRNDKIYKAILYNEKAGISRSIDPDMLYGRDGKSDYIGKT